ncbi:MAG: GAF domain-containing protein [Candidatus Acidiferrales bacterium]|jgi:uroporphyrinogen-III synthase
MNTQTDQYQYRDIAFLHEIGQRIAASDPLHMVLARVVEFVSAVVMCDSCFIYVLEDGDLTLRASKNPHAEVVDRLKLRIGQGITGWVAENKKPVVLSSNAFQDHRFQSFTELPEDRYEAFLSVPVLCRDKLVGVINVQHREPHIHAKGEVQLISTIGFLVGPEIELARMEAEKLKFADLSGARKLVEQAAQILQQQLHIDEDEANLAMQKQSRQSGKSMREVASAVLLHDELCKGLRRQV